MARRRGGFGWATSLHKKLLPELYKEANGYMDDIEAMVPEGNCDQSQGLLATLSGTMGAIHYNELAAKPPAFATESPGRWSKEYVETTARWNKVQKLMQSECIRADRRVLGGLGRRGWRR